MCRIQEYKDYDPRRIGEDTYRHLGIPLYHAVRGGMGTLEPRCVACGRVPRDIPELQAIASREGFPVMSAALLLPTFNPRNLFFVCPACVRVERLDRGRGPLPMLPDDAGMGPQPRRSYRRTPASE